MFSKVEITKIVDAMPTWNRAYPPQPQHFCQLVFISGLFEFCEEVIQPGWHILETGTCSGVSAYVFSLYADKVTTVDIATDPQAKSWLEPLGVNVVTADTFEYADEVAGCSLDLVYLDSVHEKDFLVRELHAWLPKIRLGGIMSGHDYCSMFPGVQAALLEVFGREPDKVFPDWSWYYTL